MKQISSRIIYLFIILIFGFIFTYVSFSQIPDALYDKYNFSQSSASDLYTYQIILDVEDACFEILSGNWTLAKNTPYNWYYYYTISGPGDGSGKARWIAEGLPNGNYLVEFYKNSGDNPTDARYQIISADGVSDLSINMAGGTTGWNKLGNFNINKVCVVNISDYWEGSGTILSVDALRFTYNGLLSPPSETSYTPRIGVCIDDAGGVDPMNSTTPIYKMLRLPYKMTFAVMPLRTYTAQTAEEIHTHGSEVILHQPMAALSVPNPGAGGITDSMTLEQVRTTVSSNLSALPYVVGMNNHMGSLITQQRDKMQVCCEVLKERNLFFFDSRTITTSIAYNVAKQNGLLTGERDLFIDGNNKEEAKALIRMLATRALYAPTTSHLAIGHVRDNTADALIEMVPELQAMGVEIVPISKLMAQVIEADFQPAGTRFATDTAKGDWINDENDCYSKELHDGYSKIVINPHLTRSEKATFTPSLQLQGDYEIFAIWSGDSNNANDIKAVIHHYYGDTEVDVDQSQSVNQWYYLGKYCFQAGSSSYVTLHNYNSINPGKVFRADAVKYMFSGRSNIPAELWMMY